MRLPPSRREAEELVRLKAEVDALIDRAACLEIKLDEENERLLRFIADYHARLGPLLAQIAILEADVGRARGPIEEILTRAEEAAAEASEEQATPDDPETDPERKARLKAQYRSLARRLHPDLADGEEDRQRRTKLMVRLTQAWKHEDEAEMAALEAEALDPDDAAQDLGDRIVALTRSRTALEERIKSLEDELQELRCSDWELLRRQAEEVAKLGGDLLADLATELTTRVETLKMELWLRDGTETGLTTNNLQDSTTSQPVVDARPGSQGQACSLGLCQHAHHLHKTPTRTVFGQAQ